MHVIIFEVLPFAEGKHRYFELAAELKAILADQPGFISVERFQSLMDEEKLLSISFWESEEAIIKWRQNIDHINAQKEGKDKLFKAYRIRVAEVQRDYRFSADD